MDLVDFFLLCTLLGEPELDYAMCEPPVLEVVCFLLLLMFLASSSSQEDFPPSRVWKLPRYSTHWDEIQKQITTHDGATRDSHWRRYYRMSYPVFQNLVEELRPFVPVSYCEYVRAPIELDKAVAMVLHRLSYGYSTIIMSNLYNTGPSTVGKYTQLITEILSNKEKLYSKYVQIPEGMRLNRIISRFKSESDLPNICGAIDGTHIKLACRPPRRYNPKDYFSKYGIYSVLLQGVCDCDMIFWDLCCNAPGGEHDANHFRFSPLWQKLQARDILSRPVVKIEGIDVQPYLVADAAYKPYVFLVKPFVNRKVAGNEYTEFDNLVRKGHVKIQNAFAVLKQRWQILNNLNVGLSYAAQVTVACCVLHNFCQLSGEPPPNCMDRDPHLNNNACSRVQSHSSTLVEEGRIIREALFRDWLERRKCV